MREGAGRKGMGGDRKMAGHARLWEQDVGRMVSDGADGRAYEEEGWWGKSSPARPPSPPAPSAASALSWRTCLTQRSARRTLPSAAQSSSSTAQPPPGHTKEGCPRVPPPPSPAR